MTTRERTLMTATLAALWACSPPPAEPTAEQASDAFGSRRPSRVTTRARPCRADSFFVEIPVKRTNVWPDLTFVPGVKAELENYISNTASAWFCPPGQPNCHGWVNASIESVLPQRSWPPSRADGHLRFLRVRFADTAGDPLSVLPDWQCDAVAKIRASVESQNMMLPDDEFYVGRECDATIASAQAVPTTEMLTWHLTDIGRTATPIAPPSPSNELVDFAVIDAGVMSALHSSLGVAAQVDLHPGRATFHTHGAAMPLIARGADEHFKLYDFAALDEGGSGTMADIGVALDQALFGPHSGNPSRPLVIDMSLGFAPELARPAAITGSAMSCTTYENAAGEVVRYMLDIAAQMDRNGDRAVFVSAASGNRPLRVPAGTYPAPPPDAFHTTCSPTPSGPEMFYPGEWSRASTCHANTIPEAHVALAVGAVDEFFRPTGVEIPGAETPLVAPGQHVYAAHPLASPMPVVPQCSYGPTDAYLESLPRAFTGSSVSAALVAGAAAHAQFLRAATGANPLDRLTLARVIYLSGRPLCRNTTSGVPVRMLAVDRLADAVRTCPALLACAALVPGTEPIPANTLAMCASELAACGFSSTCATPSRSGPIAWDKGYDDNALVCHDATVTNGSWQPTSTCGAACPYETNPGRSVLGSIGPQPIIPTCPDCPAVVDGQFLHLKFEITADGPDKTTLANPYLIVKGPSQSNGTPTEEFFPLPDDPNEDDWVLGNRLDLHVSLWGSAIDFSDPSQLKGSLVVDVTEPGKKTVTDYSVIDFH